MGFFIYFNTGSAKQKEGGSSVLKREFEVFFFGINGIMGWISANEEYLIIQTLIAWDSVTFFSASYIVKCLFLEVFTSKSSWPHLKFKLQQWAPGGGLCSQRDEPRHSRYSPQKQALDRKPS